MNEIDKRIVQMQFDNSQFERGVQESTKSIENLKKGLDFGRSEKAFSDLQKAGDSFSLARMADGIEALTNRFSTMGIIGMRALENITDRAMNAGEQLVRSLSLDQISSGFGKYEDKTKSVQTIVNATGLGMEEVDAQLSKLAWFTDETSYNFVDMTSNIGKFTSMGIDLGTSVTAMEGIATWAAISGQGVNEASRAMYNLSQAIGTGAVKLMDWRSIENANMGTKEFKQTAIDTAKALGVLNKQGKTSKGTIVGINNFSETLSQGWFTKDVLLATLNKYGEYANEVYRVAKEKGIPAAKAMELVSGETMKLGERAFKAAQEAKTFGEAIDATKDAVSTGWMTTFELIFGNYEEAKELWTQLAEDLYTIFAEGAEARNELLRAWKEFGGRDDLIQGLADSMQALIGIIEGVKQAFHTIFPEVTVENLQAVSTAIKDIGGTLKSMFGITEEFEGTHAAADMESFTQVLSRWNMRGDTDELGALGGAMKEFGGIFVGTNLDLVRYNNMSEGERWILGIKQNAQDLRRNVVKDMFGVSGAFENLDQTLQRGSRSDAVRKMQERLIELGYDVGKTGADGIFGPETQRALNEFKEAAGLTVDGIYDEATHQKLGEALGLTGSKNEVKLYEKFVDKLPPKLQRLKNILSGIFAILGIGVKVVQFLWEVAKKIGDTLSPIGDMLLKIADAGGRFFTALNNRLGKSNVFQNWLTSLDSALTPIKAKIEEMCQSFLDLIGLGGDLDDIDFDQIVENLVTAVKNFFGLNTDGDGVAESIDSKSIIESIKAKLIEIYEGVRDWLTSLFKKDGSNPEAGSPISFDGYRIAIAAIGILVGLMTGKLLQAVGVIVGIGKNVEGILEKVNKTLSDFRNKKKTETLEQVSEAVLKFAFAIGVLAASVFLISQLSWEQLAVGLTGVAVIVGVVIGAMFALKAAMKNFDNAEKAMTALLILSGAVAALGVVVLMMSNLGWEELARGFSGLVGLIGVSIGAIYLLSKLDNKLNNVSGTIGLIASLAGGLSMLADVVKKLGTLDTPTLARGLLSIGALVLGVAVFLRLIKNVKISGGTAATVLSMALAIDLLVGGFLVMAFAMKLLTLEDIVKGIIGMGAVVLSLIVLTKVISRVNPSTKAILSLLPMALAIDLIVLAFIAMVAIMKTASPGDIIKGIIGISVMMISMLALMKLMDKVAPKARTSIKAILTLLPVALAIDLAILGFAAMIMIMKHASPGDILKGIIGIGVVVLALIGLTKYLSKLDVKNKKILRSTLALIPIALAMDLVVVGFAGMALLMEHVGIDALVKAILAFATICVALTFMAKALSKVSPGIKGSISMLIASLAMVGAMVALAIVLEYIKDVPTDKILTFAIGLSAVMLAFAGLAFVARVVGPQGILLGAAAIVAIGVALGLLIAAFTAILNIPGVSDFLASGAEKIGTIIGNFTGAMRAADMKAFSKGMDGFKDVSDADEEAVKNALACAQLFADFSNGLPDAGIVSRLFDWIVGSKIQHFAIDMVSFAIGFNAFAAEINRIDFGDSDKGQLSDKTEKAIAIASSLKAFGADLPTYDTLEKVAAAVTGSTPLATFAKDMVGFATGFNNFANQMMLVEAPEGLEEKTASTIGIAEQLKAFGEGLPEVDSIEKLAAVLTGNTPLASFVNDMTAFSVGFTRFAVEMMRTYAPSGLEEKTTKAIGIADQLKAFGEGLPEVDSIEKLAAVLTGNTPLASFVSDMTAFATGFNNFATEMVKVDIPEGLDQKTTDAIAIADKINKLNASLPASTALDRVASWFTGTAMNSFAGDLSAFSLGMNNFVRTMGRIEIDSSTKAQTDEAVEIARKVAEFVSQLSGMTIEKEHSGLTKWFMDETSQETVFDAVGELATSISDSKDKYAGLSDSSIVTNVKNAVSAVRAIAGLMHYIGSNSETIKQTATDSTGTGWGLATTAVDEVLRMIGEVADRLSAFGATVQGLDLVTIASVMQSITDLVNLLTNNNLTISTTIFDSLNSDTAIQPLVDFAERIGLQADTFKGKGTELAGSVFDGFVEADMAQFDAFLTNCYETADAYKGSFETVGGNFAIGLANGVDFNSALAVNAAGWIATEMLNQIIAVFDSHSPSRETMALGQYFTLGLAQGTENEVGEAQQSSQRVAEAMLSTASTTLGTLSSILAEDIDDTPVIRPVVDLTDARAAAGSIGGLFGTQSFGVRSTMLANRAISTEGGRPVTLQNGRAAAITTTGGVSAEQMESFVKEIKGMKVVMQTGALVGQIEGEMDEALGERTTLRGRRN